MTDGDARNQAAVAGINGINFRVVSSGQPQDAAVGGHASHIRTASSRQHPFLDDLSRSEVDQRNAAFVAVGHIQHFGIAADVQAVGSGARRHETDLCQAVAVQ